MEKKTNKKFPNKKPGSKKPNYKKKPQPTKPEASLAPETTPYVAPIKEEKLSFFKRIKKFFGF